jgi:hypothetical protein
MSHFSQIKTRIHEQNLLEETLTRLDYAYEAGDHVMVNTEGDETMKVNLLVDVNAGEARVGFQKLADGTFNAVADWWRIEQNGGLTQQKLINTITAGYAHTALKHEVEAKGYIIEEEKVLANGEIELVVSEPV